MYKQTCLESTQLLPRTSVWFFPVASIEAKQVRNLMWWKCSWLSNHSQYQITSMFYFLMMCVWQKSCSWQVPNLVEVLGPFCKWCDSYIFGCYRGNFPFSHQVRTCGLRSLLRKDDFSVLVKDVQKMQLFASSNKVTTIRKLCPLWTNAK